VKIKTVGLAKKVPWQSGVTLVVAALAYYGVDLDPEVSAALGVIAGFAAGIGAPATPVVPVPAKRIDGEAGQGLVELVIGVLLILILVVVLLRVL
jgi:hypothetical protein